MGGGRVTDLDRCRQVGSDARAWKLDDLRFVLGEGPGVTALVDGGP